MKIQGLIKGLVAVAVALSLYGCGSGSEEAQSTTETAPPPPAKVLPPNPLSAEAETLQHAKGIQAILDQDAAEKKKALDNLN